MILSNSHTIIFWINLSVKGAGFKLLSVECREKVYFLWALLASNLLASNLLKILAITVSSVSTEAFIVSESTCLKAIELFFQIIQKLWCHYHTFSAEVSIFSWLLFKFLLKNIFLLIFELLIPWTWLTPRLLAFWEIYILMTHWWPISIPKTSNGLNRVKWCHITYFPEIDEKLLTSAEISHERWSNITFENLIAFQWGEREKRD